MSQYKKSNEVYEIPWGYFTQDYYYYYFVLYFTEILFSPFYRFLRWNNIQYLEEDIFSSLLQLRLVYV